jgi:class 3 adenylate cyclase/tetratricopeptide (TPR) repeat protein
MKCPRCQHDNPQGARFCEECATPLVRTCSNCGTALSAAAKFCHACAHAVDAVAGAPSRSPDSYTPKHLAERIINSKAALEGERKHVTVLFADLKGSMELLADRDPEEARKILDPVLERMMEAVHRYEGTVNQVMGDGIMALFGAPVAHEDHAVRACYAALRMQDEVRRYSDELWRAQGVEVQIRVGLNSGEVVVRSIGSDLRMDYTAVGQTTHLAARMEQLAAPGTVRLTGETLRLAEGYVEVRSLGPIPVKGLSDPIEIFELTGAGQARTRLQAAALRGLTRFVGRDAEVEHLRRVLGQAGAGHGQVAAIVGEAGVGKSRLTFELTHSDRVEGWLVLEAGAASHGKTTSYLPVSTLLRSYFRLGERETYEDVRTRISARLSALGESLWPAAPAFEALLDVPVEDPRWQGLEPRQRRQHTLEALRHLLLRESHIQPLLLVLEDLHWIDAETQAWLDGLVDGLPAARLLLLVTYRPEYQHAWDNRTYYTQLRVDPLLREGAEDLLQALLGADAELASLRTLLIQRTDGNPFFLEESVRALVETKALVGERGAHRLAQALDNVQVPATVQALLASRIDRLPPAEKQLLQSAAVIGKDVPFGLLHAVSDEAEEGVRRQLTYLQAAEFLYETRLFPDAEYTFKHALTQDVTYGGLLTDRRRAIHARIVTELERLEGDRLAEQVERLAHHALRGELWEKAVAYLRQAGLRAMARAANREAISHLQQALVALGRLPEIRDTIELTIDIHLDLRNAFQPLGDRARMGDHLHEAEVLARRLGDQQRLARIATFMVIQCLRAGHYDEAVRFGQEALSISQTLGDRSTEIVATSCLGMTHAARGEFNDAASLLERNIALEGELRYERFGTPGVQSALSGACLADVFSELGRSDEAIGHAEAAVQIAEAADHPFTLFDALFGLGLAHVRRGDLPRATRALERCLDVCRTWEVVVGTPVVAATLAAGYALASRADEALPLIAGAIEEDRTRPMHRWPALILLCAGMTYLSAGRIDEAASHTREALALTRRLRARGSEAHALCLAGDVASTGGAEDAEAHYREALALAGELGMRPLVAHCHLGLGKLYRRTDKREQAQEHLTTATTMYREMGMTYWLEKAEAEEPRG